MRKILISLLVLLLGVALVGCKQDKVNQAPPPQTDAADQQAVTNQVLAFGQKLSMVSLQAPTDAVIKSIKDNYGAYITTKLMDAWTKDPLKAPGRVTSSPWPDRIEVLSTAKVSTDAYEVKGNIIEITSEEKANGGAFDKIPITLTLMKVNNSWLIDDVVVSNDASGSATFDYVNSQYGFKFSLPASWKGYTIVADEWKGLGIGDSQNGKTIETGKIISIRHPLWTAKSPRQDIPIMIFSLSQWDSLQKGNYSVSAAPIGPSELGRNTHYVFALPARYNFAFPTGYEEVEKIVASKPLSPID